MLSQIDRDRYIKTAKQLGYSAEIIEGLKLAQTDAEAARILKTARNLGLRKDDKVNDQRIEDSKPKRKKVVRKKNQPSIAKMSCPRCGSRTENDYYIVNITRIKDGYPYMAKFQTLWCPNCYNDIYNASKGK